MDAFVFYTQFLISALTLYEKLLLIEWDGDLPFAKKSHKAMATFFGWRLPLDDENYDDDDNDDENDDDD